MMKRLLTLFSVLFFAMQLQATIHYEWNVSDQVGAGAFAYDLDLNGDNDVSFNEQGSQYYVNTISINNKFAAEGSSGIIPKAYSDGAALGTYHWQNGLGSLMDWSSNSGNFYNVDKYLMVRFVNGTNVHYGWIFLVGSGDYIWIEGYAYSDVPDEIIKAGQTVSVKELEDVASVIAQLNSGSVTFKNCNAFDRVQAINFNGQLSADIQRPQENVSYPLNDISGWCVLAFYRENELLFTHRYGVNR